MHQPQWFSVQGLFEGCQPANFPYNPKIERFQQYAFLEFVPLEKGLIGLLVQDKHMRPVDNEMLTGLGWRTRMCLLRGGATVAWSLPYPTYRVHGSPRGKKEKK